MPKSSSFTSRFNGIAIALLTECSVCPGYEPESCVGPDSPTPPNFEPFLAIWDTGATGSVINQKVVDACSLKPTGMMQCHGVHGTQTVETYLVNILLPNKVVFQNVQVTKGQLGDEVSVLIGMDIISAGDFSITNCDGVTLFSYRIPSQRHIDYVAMHHQESIRENQTHGGNKRARKKPPRQRKSGKKRK